MELEWWGAGVGAGVDGARVVGAGVGEGVDGAGVVGAGVGAEVDGAGVVGAGVGAGDDGAGVVGAGVGTGVDGAGVVGAGVVGAEVGDRVGAEVGDSVSAAGRGVGPSRRPAAISLISVDPGAWPRNVPKSASRTKEHTDENFVIQSQARKRTIGTLQPRKSCALTEDHFRIPDLNVAVGYIFPINENPIPFHRGS